MSGAVEVALRGGTNRFQLQLGGAGGTVHIAGLSIENVVNDPNPLYYHSSTPGGMDQPCSEQCESGRNIYGVQGVHLNPLGLFLRTSTPRIRSIMNTFLLS
jgi:hypothetical protein